MDEECIGIDLGTTYSSVGVWQHGDVKVIANDSGNRITPSCVAFNESERLIGDAAMYQAVMNPNNTVFDAKRLIGRKFTDITVQSDMKHWPFKVVEGAKNTPMIELKYKGEKKQFRAEEISAMVLTKMKSIAEDYLGKKVKNAVITVPAYFDASQRQSTKDAGKIAGLNVLRIISEPTAAALAYGLHVKETEKNILVFDLGGGTFDVSVLNIKNGAFKVMATAGDTHLGGEDFDNRIVDYFVEQFREKYHKNVTDNPRSLRRLRTACEKAKRLLSSTNQAPIELDALYEGIDFKSMLTRSRFEDLCYDYFKKCIEVCNGAILDSKVSKDDIDDIVLVGGSTRIPKIRSMVSEMFKGKELCQSINPDEAVAYGATVQATMLSKVDTSGKFLNLVLYDVTPLSLGVDIHGGLMSTIIPRNTTIPVQNTKVYFTIKDNQTSIGFNVYEGERSMANDNKLLGYLNITGLKPLPRGEATCNVTFDIDANGLLNASAIDKITGNVEKIVISYDTDHLSKDDVECMISDAKRYQIEDEATKKRAEAKIELENYCFALKSKLKSNEIMRMISAKHMEILNAAIGIAIKLTETNPLAELREYKDKQNELEEITRLILNSSYGDKKDDIPGAEEKKPFIGIVGNVLLKLALAVAGIAISS